MEEIKNECKDVCKNNFMNEEDLLNDILMCEKNISNNYSIAINEMSNRVLYKKIINIFIDTKDLARDIYNFMFENGWYTISVENDSKIEKSCTKYQNKLKELK